MKVVFRSLTVILIFAAACSSLYASGQEETVVADAEPQGTVTFINVWSGSRVPLMEQLIADFQKLHPKIMVKSEVIPQAGMEERYLTSIASGTPSDVIMLKRDSLPYFASQNALLELDSYLEKDGMDFFEIFYEAEAKLSQWENKTYVLPNSTATGWSLMFWNKGMFREAGMDPEKPPVTWQDISAVNAKFLKMEEGEVRGVGLPMGAAPNEFYYVWLGSNNGLLLSEDKKKVLIDTPEARETLSWVVGELEKAGGIEKLNSFFDYATPVGGWTPATLREVFYNSYSAILRDGVWMFHMLETMPPQPIEYGTALLPYNGNNPKARSTLLVDGGWGYAIPKNAKNAPAAWEWIKYACAEEGSKDFFQAQNGRPTPIKEFNQDQWYYDNNPYWSVVLKDAENATYSPPLPVSPQIKNAINTAVEPVLYGKTSVEAALKEAAATAQKILDDYWAKQN
jgi:multiple sugar transport system substrate-binding protein